MSPDFFFSRIQLVCVLPQGGDPFAQVHLKPECCASRPWALSHQAGTFLADPEQGLPAALGQLSAKSKHVALTGMDTFLGCLCFFFLSLSVWLISLSAVPECRLRHLGKKTCMLPKFRNEGAGAWARVLLMTADHAAPHEVCGKWH